MKKNTPTVEKTVSNNPWKGLDSYSYADSKQFFGREREIEDFVNTIERGLFTVIYGISGAGKSSFVEAGLRPHLNKSNKYLTVSIRLEHKKKEGEQLASYAKQIIDAIKAEAVRMGCEIETPQLPQMNINAEERLWLFLQTSTIWSETNHRLLPVIFIDQFEEIYTKELSHDKINEFFATVGCLQNNIPPQTIADVLEESDMRLDFNGQTKCKIVLSMREDFLARLEDWSQNYPAFSGNRVGMKRMNGLQARDVIMRPRPGMVDEDVAYSIISKVVGQAIKTDEYHLRRLDVDTSILSLLCTELYNIAYNEKGTVITQEIVDKYGSDILASFYNRCMAKVSKRTKDYLEEQLITKSGFRDSIAFEDALADGIKEEELRTLAGKDTRLIRIEDINGTERIEFMHDVICKMAKEQRNAKTSKSERRRQAYFIGFTAVYSIWSVIAFFHACSVFYINAYSIGILFVFLLFYLNYSYFFSLFEKNRWSALTSLGNLLLNIIAFKVVDDVYRNKYIGSGINITVCYLILQMILASLMIVVSLVAFEKQKPLRQTMVDYLAFRLARNNDLTYYMFLLPVVTMMFVVLSLFLGLGACENFVFFSVPAFSAILYLMVTPGGGKLFEKKRLLPLIALVVAPVLMLACQYVTSHYIYILTCVALAVGSIYYNFVKQEGEIAKRIATAIYLFLAIVVFLPCLSAGSNLFSPTLAKYERVWHGDIRPNRTVTYMKIADENGNVGLADQFGVLIPTNFKDIINAASFCGIYSGWGDLQYSASIYDKILPSARALYNDDEMRCDVVFAPVSHAGTVLMWNVSDHLDIENRLSDEFIANYLRTDQFENYRALARYFAKTDSAKARSYALRALLADLRSAKIEEYVSCMGAYTMGESTQKNQIGALNNILSREINKDRVPDYIDIDKSKALFSKYLYRPVNYADSTLLSKDSVSVYFDYEKSIVKYMSDAEVIAEIKEFANYPISAECERTMVNYGLSCSLNQTIVNNRQYFQYYKDIALFAVDSIYCKYDDYNSFVNKAFYALFYGDISAAEEFSRNAIEQNDKNIVAYTNLVTSLYLQKKYDDCFSLIDKYKDYVSGNRVFGRSIFEDICEFISCGIWTDFTSEHYKKLMQMLEPYTMFGENNYIKWVYGNEENSNNPAPGSIGVVYMDNYSRHFKVQEDGTWKLLPWQAYKNAWAFEDGVAPVMNEEDLAGFIDLNGNIYSDFKYKIAVWSSRDFHNGYIVVVDETTNNEGLLDNKGNLALGFDYYMIYEPNQISENEYGHFRIVGDVNLKYGVLDDRAIEELAIPLGIFTSISFDYEYEIVNLKISNTDSDSEYEEYEYSDSDFSTEYSIPYSDFNELIEAGAFKSGDLGFLEEYEILEEIEEAVE